MLELTFKCYIVLWFGFVLCNLSAIACICSRHAKDERSMVCCHPQIDAVSMRWRRIWYFMTERHVQDSPVSRRPICHKLLRHLFSALVGRTIHDYQIVSLQIQAGSISNYGRINQHKLGKALWRRRFRLYFPANSIKTL